MLDVTLEMITQTASSSLFAFCFCNLIIVIILVGSKPGSEFNQEDDKRSPLLVPSNSNTSTNYDELKKPKELVLSKEAENAKRLLVVEEIGEASEEDDDELRKRVEEFIQKVNREWKAEFLKTAHLIEA